MKSESCTVFLIGLICPLSHRVPMVQLQTLPDESELFESRSDGLFSSEVKPESYTVLTGLLRSPSHRIPA